MGKGGFLGENYVVGCALKVGGYMSSNADERDSWALLPARG